MLVSMRIKNYRTIKKDLCLDMRASSIQTHRECYVRKPTKNDCVLNLAAIYGPNGSGKTNILMALDGLRRYICDGVIDSSIGKGNRSMFQVGFIQSGKSYLYTLNTLQGYVDIEELAISTTSGYTSGYKTIMKRSYGFGEHKYIQLDPSLKSLESIKDAPPNVSLLTHANVAKIENEHLINAYSWFSRTLAPIITPNSIGIIGTEYTPELHEYVSYEIKHLLPHIDKLEDLGNESRGTIKYIKLMAALYDIINNDRVVLIDEIDSSLHPKMVKNFVVLFLREMYPDERLGQIIFTANDTTVIREKNLVRNDTIWLVDRDPKDGTTINRAVDYKDIEKYNIGLLYEMGVLGGVPNLTI